MLWDLAATLLRQSAADSSGSSSRPGSSGAQPYNNHGAGSGSQGDANAVAGSSSSAHGGVSLCHWSNVKTSISTQANMLELAAGSKVSWCCSACCLTHCEPMNGHECCMAADATLCHNITFRDHSVLNTLLR